MDGAFLVLEQQLPRGVQGMRSGTRWQLVA
jgi:hypothetical protein